MNERASLNRILALIGLLTTLGLLGALYFLHTWATAPFPPYDIAEAVVAVTPGSLATLVIEQLGVWAQRTLKLAGVGAVLLTVAALVPWLNQRLRAPWLQVAALAGLPFGVTLLLHAAVPGRAPIAPLQLIALIATFTAWAILTTWLTRRWRKRGQPTVADRPEGPDRRLFLAAVGIGSLGVVLAGLLGADQLTLRRARQAALTNTLPPRPTPEMELPPSGATAAPASSSTAAPPAASVASPAPAATAGAAAPPTTAPPAFATPAATPTFAPGTPLPVFEPAPGARPNLTPLAEFYVVDKAVVDPDVEVEQWQLTVTGLVDRPLTLRFADLLALPRVEAYATLQCISNPVGGPLIGTSLFSGCRLVDVLDQAGVQADGVEIVLRCLDGYSESLTVDKARDKNTLLVYGMDGKLLEQAHGYPLRLLNPDHYGVKHPKWIVGLEVVSAPYDGYWVRLGWDKDAFVKTTSVIDAPGLIKANPRPAPIGGIAFAGWRGIQRVDVKIDDQDFIPAVLERPLSALTWVRWRLDWANVTPGEHRLTVRATDGTGTEQDAIKKPPHPDGASGWHTVTLRL